MTQQPREDSPIDAQLAAPPAAHPVAEQTGYAPPRKDFLQNRGAVLAILFLVTGVLGLPLLWINRKFSNVERVLWSIIVTLYTVALVALVAAIVVWAYRRVFPV
jgi:hypothetical protein